MKEKIQKAIHDSNRGAEYINLFNTWLYAGDVQPLCDVLNKNHSVLRLNLYMNHLGPNGARLLADVLKQNTVLEVLQLDDNAVGDEGCGYLMEALKINASVHTLGLERNELGPESGQLIGDALKANYHLENLFLGRNNLRSEGSKDIAHALRVNSTLKKLGLQRNEIGEEGGRLLAESLKSNTCLKTLLLEVNPFHETTGEFMFDALSTNRALERLDIVNIDYNNENVGTRFVEFLKNNHSMKTLNLHPPGLTELVQKLLEKTPSERLGTLRAILFHDEEELILTAAGLRCMVQERCLFKAFVKWMINGNVVGSNAALASLFRENSDLPDCAQWRCEVIHGGLDLGGATVSALPDGLVVTGSLGLSQSSIRKLPSGLHVGGNLYIRQCVNLLTLPDDFFVGKDVHMEGCVEVRSLPSCVLSWVGDHSIFLQGSGLSGEESHTYLQRLNPPENLLFHFSMENLQQQDECVQQNFPSLKEAVEYWAALGHIENEEQVYLQEKVELSMKSSLFYINPLIQFLSRLRGSKEFVLQETRKDLAKRVVDMLYMLIEKDPQHHDDDDHDDNNKSDLKEQILIRVGDSLDRCDDKPIWALNQITQIVLIAKARGNRDKLRQLGKRVMRLGVVHEHAKRKCQTSQFVDVCIYLKFEIELCDVLDLPVSSSAMHFPNYAEITDEELEDAKNEAIAVSEGEAFESWLGNWHEWQREIRREQAETIHFAELPKRKSIRWRQSLVDMLGNKTDQAVELNGNQWSFPDLMRHWIETGCDLNNTPISFRMLKNNLTKR